MMNSKIELLVIQLRSETEDVYLSKECKEKIIQDVVKV